MKGHRPLGWTTLEEAKRLVEAGLDPNTADMCYIAKDYIDGKELRWYTKETVFEKYREKAFYVEVLNRDQTDFYPCWSLGALKNIVEEEFGKDFSYENGEWIIIVWTNTWGYKHCYFEEIVNCVIWILENGYIKKQE